MQYSEQDFNNWLKLNGRSTNTRANYCQRVRDFLNSIDNNATQENVDKYFLDLQSKYTSKTINCYRNAISAYIRWSKIDLQLPQHLPEPQKIPDAVSAEAFENTIIPIVELAFEGGTKKRDIQYAKTKAIFYLLFFSGLRPSEIVSLKRKNINLDNLQGKVYCPKTKREIIFNFTEKVKNFIKVYFLLEHENQNAFNITTRSLGRMFERIKKDFPDINLRPYLFRHSAATNLLNKGIDISHIAHFLGHKDISTTQKYLKVDDKTFKKIYHEKIK